MSDYQDEHAGKGGSYVIDANGKRVLQERTGHKPVQTAAQLAATPAKPKKNPKEVSNA